MTFLELCQKLARQSGAINPAPTSVVGGSRRQVQCVEWISTAWADIQNLSPFWSWLRGEFEGTLSVDQMKYSAADLDLTRFKRWIEDLPRYPALSLYDPAIGRNDESALRQIPYEAWRQTYDYRTHDHNRPTHWAIAPDRTLRFGAKPNKAYKVRGEYLMTPQVLAADSDVPDMPEEFHDMIWRRALVIMSESDEAVQEFQFGTAEYGTMMAQLMRDCLPEITVGGSPPIDR